ncbi:MAG: DEAD/DEAH box helicase [Ferrimicrobium sp.]
MNSATFSLEDTLVYFGAREIHKGRGYLGSIIDLVVHDDYLTGLVQGSAVSPYRTLIRFDRNTMLAVCSCPVGTCCKHGAAVALAALDVRDQVQAHPSIRPRTQTWLSELRHGLEPPPEPKKRPAQFALIWLAYPEASWLPPRLECQKVRLKANGSRSTSIEPWQNFELALRNRPKFITDTDYHAIRSLWLETTAKGNYYHSWLALGPTFGADVLESLAAQGNLWSGPDGVGPLELGESRTAKLSWELLRSGEQTPHLDLGTSETWPLVVGERIFYIDPEQKSLGEVLTELPPATLSQVMASPPLNPTEAVALADVLTEFAPAIPKPRADPASALRVIDAPLQPKLRLGTLSLPVTPSYPWMQSTAPSVIDFAYPQMQYGESLFTIGDDLGLTNLSTGEMVRITRDPAAEKRAVKQLEETGLAPLDRKALSNPPQLPRGLVLGLKTDDEWTQYLSRSIPILREQGWEIELEPSFRHHHATVSAWHMDINDGDAGWLSLDLGITVDDQQLDLIPLLVDLFARDRRWLIPSGVGEIDDDEVLVLRSEGLPPIHVPASRLKPMVGTLIDLFSRDPSNLSLSRYDATRVKELADQPDWNVGGLDRVLSLAELRLSEDGPAPVAPPSGLTATLRPYQLAGLAWLQFLREHDLSGILADDMGLGKTVQALSHILIEKEQGRLSQPALVVVPTTLLHTWRDEANRFTPELRVLTLHGKDRLERIDEIKSHDLILTTYPLIWRDIDELNRFSFHMMILDEAQMVKNPTSRTALAVRKVDATHRLCLTGTPLENHLSDLWSHFDLLLPGFLGDKNAFRQIWGTPVEQHNDRDRLELLAKRVRPFILRRRKEEVATELPPKTIVVRSVDIEGSQRDLYETIRAAMDTRIRAEVAAKGFERSQIIILDALLKLRQVCCDPRLVKSSSAKAIDTSAKRAVLMDMIPELLSEGRRILLFSQFTEMLDLIQADLDHAKIPHLLLTGQTQDRITPVKRFQNLEVPLLLLSLKAGGVGLNLTAADTVIHYDPWWNPAAEDQASDRAHRIGQTKRVFVYKLIVAGSIEEKILSLQQKKAELAAGILDAAQAGTIKFGLDDIEALFEPIPQVPRT